MSIKRKAKLFLLPFILLGLITTFAWTNANAEENDPIPSFSIPSLFQPGKKLSSKQFKGQVSLLTIWGSWCGACRAEHSMLMYIRNHSRVPMYSIIYKDNSQSARSYLQRAGNPYVATGIDSNGAVGSAFGIYGTPETYIIDKKGIIRYQYVGAITMSVWQNEMLPIIKKYSS